VPCARKSRRSRASPARRRGGDSGVTMRASRRAIKRAAASPCVVLGAFHTLREHGRELLPSSILQRFFSQRRRIFLLPHTFGIVQTSAVVSNLERNCPMSMHSHLADLERRHRMLEKEIETEKLHPSSDDLHIAELKRKKLAIKDQIEQLRMRSDEPERVLH
jgi:hypothetical protein